MLAVVSSNFGGMPAVAAYAFHVADKLGFDVMAFTIPFTQTETTEYLDNLLEKNGITLALVFTDFWMNTGLEFGDTIYTYRNGEGYLDHAGNLFHGSIAQVVRAFLPEDRPTRTATVPEPVIEYLEGMMTGKKSRYHGEIQSGLRSIEDLVVDWDPLRAPRYRQAVEVGGKMFERHLALFGGNINLGRVLLHGQIIQNNLRLMIAKRVSLRSGSGILRGHAYALVCNPSLDSVAAAHEALHHQHPAAPLTIVMVPWPTISKIQYYIKSWDEAIDVSTLSLGLEQSAAGVYWEVPFGLQVPDVSEHCPAEEAPAPTDTVTTIESIRTNVSDLADQLRALHRDLDKPRVDPVRLVSEHIADALHEQETAIADALHEQVMDATVKPARTCVMQ